MFTVEPVRPVLNAGWDPRIRAFRCGDTVDSFAVITQRFLVLVDTMVNLESITAVMESLIDELGINEMRTRSLLVINTHGDWDHVWGNGLFAAPDARYPAPIIGHRRTAEIMRSPDAAALLVTFKADHPGQYDSAEIWPPNICFDGELSIEGGDLTLQLIPTPGHTPDHLAVWIPEIRFLLTGDASELPFPSVADAAAMPVLRASLQRLADLDAETALYCHAPGISDPALIGSNIAYFDELERHCREALEAGPPPQQNEALPAYINWPFEQTLPYDRSVDDIPTPDYYRETYDGIIRAMLDWLARTPA